MSQLRWRLPKNETASAALAVLLTGVLFPLMFMPTCVRRSEEREALAATNKTLRNKVASLERERGTLASEVDNKSKALAALQADNDALRLRISQAPAVLTDTTGAEITSTTGSTTTSQQSQVSTPREDFSGKWDWGDFSSRVRIFQKSDGSVNGEFTRGTLRGHVVKDRLMFEWEAWNGKGSGFAMLRRGRVGERVISGRYCWEAGCDPDDPRQDRPFKGSPTEW